MVVRARVRMCVAARWHRCCLFVFPARLAHPVSCRVGGLTRSSRSSDIAAQGSAGGRRAPFKAYRPLSSGTTEEDGVVGGVFSRCRRRRSATCSHHECCVEASPAFPGSRSGGEGALFFRRAGLCLGTRRRARHSSPVRMFPRPI